MDSNQVSLSGAGDVTCYRAINALDVNKEKQAEILSKMYEEIPKKEKDEFKKMKVEDVKEEIDSFLITLPMDC